MKQKISSIILTILCVSFLMSSCTQRMPGSPNGIQITDMAGREVIVPQDPQSICVLDAFAAPIIVMLGYGDKMPTTINAVSRNLLLQSICPSLGEAVVVKTSGSINAETMLKMKTELIIVGSDTYGNIDEKAKLDTLGIPYIVLSYVNMADQMKAVTLLGEALQNKDMAQKYVQYYKDCIDLVTDGVSGMTNKAGIKLYHSVNEATRTDVVGTLGADWIGLMRINNVSLEAQLNSTEDKSFATLEQIYIWDPDIIIANESGVADYILTDSKWQGLRAVIDKNVHQIPVGLSRWGHPTSVETPLAILWLAELLYPAQFSINIQEETASFFKMFYNYTISDEEMAGIISGNGTRTPKTISDN